MEEDDHDELLQCTDDESLSETEDQCLPIDKPEDSYRHTLIFFSHTKLEFLITKLSLIISTTAVLILLPLYIDAINVAGDVYTLVLICTGIATLLFIIATFSIKILFNKYKNLKLWIMPMKFTKLLQLSGIYIVSGLAIVYSLDRKRVLCHLQDPIKGIVLVCSLLYYFFFCRKLMGLQRIFSATTIIVGLFIAVDYGLCDEFRCRGYERERISDDAGHWSWQIHSVWTTIYIFSLALIAGYFTLFERHLLANNELESLPVNLSTSLLSTVSRSVSYPANQGSTSNLIVNGNRTQENVHLCKKQSTVHLAMWLHLINFVIVIALFWTDFIPQVGKGSPMDFINHTANGFICHFRPSGPSCGNVSLYGWLFILFYVTFALSSIKFLILTQSAVYTVATMATALPLVGIWWSLIHMTPQNGLVWAPSVTGELICSLLGLPIILIGLCLLCKSHFKDYQWSKLAATHVMSSSHLA